MNSDSSRFRRGFTKGLVCAVGHQAIEVETIMPELKIRLFKVGESDPETTITVPGGVLKIASRLIPKGAMNALQEKGIDLDEIVRLSENPEARGTLIEVEEHGKNERIVIALEVE